MADELTPVNGRRPRRAKAAKAPWPADQVERRPLAQLIPYAGNPRKHSPTQVAQLKASMTEFGWTIPVLVDERGEVIAGHGRIIAASELGYTTAPVMTARGWTKAQIKAYRIADNQLTMNSWWEPELLRLELGELVALNFDLDLTGLDRLSLDGLLIDGVDGGNDPDQAWSGMPEYANEDLNPVQKLIVNFASHKDVHDFAELIGQPLTEHTRSIWYPQAEIGRTADKRYASDQEERPGAA